MTRGDIVLVALSGDYGKPRPAVVVQNDAVSNFDSVLICPLTTTVLDAETVRVAFPPTPDTGLNARSEVMTEKLVAVSRSRLRARIGRAPPEAMDALTRRLALLLAIG